MTDHTALPKPPPLTPGKFDADNFHDLVHTAQHFSVQYQLWDITIGETPSPAGEDIEPSVTSRKIDIGSDSGPRADGRFLRDNPDPNRLHKVQVYKWNEKHSLTYNYYLLDAVKPEVAYSRIVGCKTVVQAWQQFITQCGSRSDAKLGTLEERLFQLKKAVDTSMSKHIRQLYQPY
jgi:hypothetical protein